MIKAAKLADEKRTVLRFGNSGWWLPIPSLIRGNFGCVLVANPINDLSTGSELLLGPLEEGIVHSKSPTDSKVEVRFRSWVVFHASPKGLNSIEIQSSDDFGKEGGLLLIAFDQNALNIRSGHTDGYGRKAGTGANVGEPTMPYGNVADGEHAFPEMEAEDFTGICDRCEGHFVVPTQQQFDVDSDALAQARRGNDPVNL
jgi:hypothetical protein